MTASSLLSLYVQQGTICTMLHELMFQGNGLSNPTLSSYHVEYCTSSDDSLSSSALKHPGCSAHKWSALHTSRKYRIYTAVDMSFLFPGLDSPRQTIAATRIHLLDLVLAFHPGDIRAHHWCLLGRLLPPSPDCGACTWANCAQKLTPFTCVLMGVWEIAGKCNSGKVLLWGSKSLGDFSVPAKSLNMRKARTYFKSLKPYDIYSWATIRPPVRLITCHFNFVRVTLLLFYMLLADRGFTDPCPTLLSSVMFDFRQAHEVCFQATDIDVA